MTKVCTDKGNSFMGCADAFKKKFQQVWNRAFSSVTRVNNKTPSSSGDVTIHALDILTPGDNITIIDDVISSTGGGSGNYNDLENKPKVNSVTLQGNKTLSQLGIQPAGSYATTEQLGDVEEDLEEQIALKQNELTAGAGIAITDDVISCTVPGFSIEVVQVLPASGETGKIYLVPVITPGTQNIYNEFIWVNSAWEQIGTTQIDLSQYKVWSETKTYVDTADSGLTAQIALKQSISGMPHIKWEIV